MPENNKKSNLPYFIVGISLGVGAISVLLYMLLRRRCKEILLPIRLDKSQTYTFIPPKPIRIPVSGDPADMTKEIIRSLPLEISSKPGVFIRGETGTVVVKSLPGTRCDLSATYSTGVTPVSLNTGTITIGPAGQHRWIWDIGTKGTYVDISVHAEKEGYEAVDEALRVDING